jgi:hypothetical protein
MDYEYLEDVAGELEVDSDRLQRALHQLGIKTLQLAAPPYGVELSTAVKHRDAERLRSYFAAQSGKAPLSAPSGACPGGATCRRVSTH